MADPEPRAPEARAARPSARERGQDSPAEDRVFETGADVARRTAETGAQNARDLTRAGAQTGRRLAESGTRMMDRSADLWRQSMFPLTSFSFEMNRLFDELWRTALPGPSLSPLSAPAGLMQGLMGLPVADLHETEDAYHISIELAGMRPEEVEVMLDGDSLVVRGEKRDVHREERSGFRVNERRFGRFERRFNLPRDIDHNGIEADFHDGVLEIRAARRSEDEDNRRRIEIRNGGGGQQARGERGERGERGRDIGARGGGMQPRA